MTKTDALKLFELPKLAEYTDFEIYQRKRNSFRIMGISELEGTVFPDSFKLFKVEIARGELPELDVDIGLYLEHKARLENKVAELAKYGLTYDDL